MKTMPSVRVMALLMISVTSIGLSACSASSQGLSSRNFDTPGAKPGTSKSQPTLLTAPTLNLNLSVDAAYAAIPHRRTAMNFSGSSMPESDKRFLEVAFHVIDQGIRLRVSAYQNFSRGELSDSQISDFDTLINYLQNIETPESLARYQARVLQALSDQRAYFQEWQTQGAQFQFGSSQTLGSHPKVRSSSTALREAYGILMELYPGENDTNKEAFFDYHCALDFI